MRYIAEYRDPQKAKRLLDTLKNTVTQPWSIMEVCGGQTHSLVKNGIIDMLPDLVTMIHGPGCPVCVTPTHLIDKAIYLALERNVILCSFGDMLRVPGSRKSLLKAKAEGADIRILYSPLEAVSIAERHPDRQVVFFAVGFETTAPANALSVIHAQRKRLANYTLLVSHVLVPPAIEAVADDEQSRVDGFLAAGHVCTIMGTAQYVPLAKKYNVPIVVTGFEPLDVLQGILMVVNQLEKKRSTVENQYARMVKTQGNVAARALMDKVFQTADRHWRGIGLIPRSGLELREPYASFDARVRFAMAGDEEAAEHPDCISGAIMKGIKKPFQCAQFAKACTPETPLGAPMVSSEGACAAYYHFSGVVRS